MDKARQVKASEFWELFHYLKGFGDKSFLVTGQLIQDWQRGTIEGRWWEDRWPEPQLVVCFRGGITQSTLIIFSINCDTAFHVLSQVQLHPGFLFFAVPDSVVPSIEKVASMQNYSLKFETCYTYVLGNTKATVNTDNQYFLQSEFLLDRLTVEDAVMVNRFWPYADKNSNRTLEYIRFLIQSFPSACVRRKDDQRVFSTSLVGWVLCNDYGAIGMLHVLEEYRNRGFAKAMVSKLTADILEWQKSQTPPERPPPYCFIVTTNSRSLDCCREVNYPKPRNVVGVVVDSSIFLPMNKQGTLTQPPSQRDITYAQLLELQSLHEKREYNILLQKSNKILQNANASGVSKPSTTSKKLLVTLQARCFALLKLGRTKEALETVDKLLVESFKTTEILYYKSYALYSQYQLEEALECCNQIKELDPQRNCINLEAQSLFRFGRYKEAAELFCQYLNFHPSKEIACNAAAAQVLCGNPNEALSICQKQPDSYEIMFIEACAYCEIGRYEKAEQCLLAAIQQCSNLLQEASPEEVEDELLPLRTQLAYVYQMSHREIEAEQLLNDLVTKRTNDQNSYSVAVCNLVSLRGYREVHDSLKRLKSITSKNSFMKLTNKQQVAILLNRLVLLLHLRKWDACLSGLEQLKKREEWELVLYVQCCILDKQRKWDEAIQFIRDFCLLHPELSFACDAIMAQIYLNKGDLKGCIEILKHSNNFSHYPGVICTVACLYELLGETSTAVQMMRELVQNVRGENGKKLIVFLGRLLRRKHLYGEAKQLLEEYLSQHPNDLQVVAENVLATCHVELNNAVAWADQLPSFTVDSSVQTEEIESRTLGFILRGYRSSSNVEPKQRDNNNVRKKRRRRGKKPLPRGYDPNRPPPDPEKWLPKSARNAQKKKKKSNKHLESAKMQGSDVSKVDNHMTVDWSSAQVNDSQILSDRPKGVSRRKAPRKRRQ